MGEYERFCFSLKKNKSSPFWGAESEKNPPGSLSQTFIHSPENVFLFFTDEKNIDIFSLHHFSSTSFQVVNTGEETI